MRGARVRGALCARAGGYDLSLTGTLEGGAEVEVLRELNLEGTVQEWSGELSTGPLKESVGAKFDHLRLVRGPYYEGDREITTVLLTQGDCDARVPSGKSSLQVPEGLSQTGVSWNGLRRVEIPRTRPAEDYARRIVRRAATGGRVPGGRARSCASITRCPPA